MKYSLSATLALLLSTNALASDGDLFFCESENGPNGLGIRSLILDVSNEDPDATMTLAYGNNPREQRKRNMAYEGTSTEYSFIPYSDRDGTVRVRLNKDAQTSAWTAVVSDEHVYTVSVLACSKW